MVSARPRSAAYVWSNVEGEGGRAHLGAQLVLVCAARLHLVDLVLLSVGLFPVACDVLCEAV